MKSQTIAFPALTLLLFFSLAGAWQACAPKTTTPATEVVVSQQRFLDMMKQKNTVILDVRTASEYREGHIPGAILLDVLQPESFQSGLSQLDKTKTYLVYCRSGKRSQQAIAIMKEKGLSKYYDLQGGFSQWTGPREQ